MGLIGPTGGHATGVNAPLEKTTTILHRVRGALYAPEKTRLRDTSLMLDPAVLLEMREPETITVTIEIGDKLNLPLPESMREHGDA